MGDTETIRRVMDMVIFVPFAFVMTTMIGRILWRVGSQLKPRAAAAPAINDPRMDRLELAIESIAVEVERISELQRFTVTLLSDRHVAREGERVSELPLIAPTKQITPH